MSGTDRIGGALRPGSGGHAIAAVVLAAGRSSRMGSSKPLLPLGSISVLERVVEGVRRAGIDEIVVVTGHEAERLAPVLERLRVRVVRNADYDRGMFSSVRSGVGALPRGVDAFFVFPVDYALVGSTVLKRLAAEFSPERHGVLHPCCCGRRGHPPLISGRYREALLRAEDQDGLDGFLRRTVEPQVEVEVADATVLMDMDTIEDHRRMARFAANIDAAGAAGAPAPSPEDALYLLTLLGSPGQVVDHCRAVAAVAAALGRAVKPLAPALDVDLAYAGGLLHDMARSSQKHALVGRDILANLGLKRLAEVVGAHMVLPAEQVLMTRVTEEQLVYLADKLVVGDRVGSLDERAARTLDRLGGARTPAEVFTGASERMQAAEAIQHKLEAILGRGLSEVLQ